MLSGRELRRTTRPQNAFHLKLPEIHLGEFDIGGVLYHARYFHLYEQGRERLLSSKGIPYSSLVSSGMHFPLTESTQAFIRPISYGQAVKLYLWVEELRRTTVTFAYELRTCSPEGDEQSVNYATTKHACIQKLVDGEFKPLPLPKNIYQIFSKLEKDSS